MNESISISILIPARNSEDYIDECIQSVIGQIEEKDQIIVIDNDSKDNTSFILNRYRTYKNIKIIHLSEMVSLFESRMLAINNSSADYLLFLDSDDLLMPSSIKILKECINGLDNPDLLIFRSESFNEYGHTKESKKIIDCNQAVILKEECLDAFYQIFFESDILNNVWIKCVNRKCIQKKYQNFNGYKNFTYCEDRIHTSIFFQASTSVAYIPKVLYRYRKHESAASKFSTKNWIEEFIKVCDYFSDVTSLNVFKKYQQSNLIYSKLTYCKLVFWYFGQHHKKMSEFRDDLNSIISQLNASKMNFERTPIPNIKYNLVYKLIQHKQVLLLSIISKVFMLTMHKEG